MVRRFLLSLALITGLSACRHAPEPDSHAEHEEGLSDIVTFPAASREVFKLATASVQLQEFTTTREALGQLAARPEAKSVVHAPIPGHVVKVHVKPGDRVEAGAPLATLTSAALGSAQSTYLKAKGEADLARKARNRQRDLMASDLSSRQEVDAAEQRDASAQLELAQAKEELRLLGLSEEAIASLQRIDPQVVLRAPMAGTVVERNVAVGQYVVPDSSEPLFELLDLRTVRVEASFPERDFLALSPGLPAKVTLSAMPGRPFEGKVVALSPVVEEASRTGQALIDLPNPDGKLKPGMSVTVTIPLIRPDVPVIPAAALQREGDRAFVYVPLDDERYREVLVTVGEATEDVVELLSGLKVGTPVVTQGSFDLRSHARKDQFGGEHE